MSSASWDGLLNCKRKWIFKAPRSQCVKPEHLGFTLLQVASDQMSFWKNSFTFYWWVYNFEKAYHFLNFVQGETMDNDALLFRGCNTSRIFLLILFEEIDFSDLHKLRNTRWVFIVFFPENQWKAGKNLGMKYTRIPYTTVLGHIPRWSCLSNSQKEP